jgi:hypothetical protein
MPQCHNLELQGTRERITVDTSSNSAQTMGFMVLAPNNNRGHQIDVIPEKDQEYQAVRVFGKDRCHLSMAMAHYTLWNAVKNSFLDC